jgi:colanic acid/amylovoran biosynthesis glycosyltransferase
MRSTGAGRAGGPRTIAYLVSRYPAVNHTFVLREVIALREAGVPVEVIAIRGDDRAPSEVTAIERDERQRTFYILPVRARFFAAHVRTFAIRPRGYLRGLVSALRLAGSDLGRVLAYVAYFAEAVVAGHHACRAGASHVHSHFASTVALLMARVFPVTVSYTIHGPDEFNDVHRFRMREKVASARFVIAISHYARSQIMRASDAKHWQRIEVCRLGVDPERFGARTRRLPHETKEILCVARLAPVKAQRLLMLAVARLRSRGRNVRLRLVGPGPDRVELESAAEQLHLGDVVVFEGPCHQDRILDLYRRADVFALASFAEGVPVVLMEAMAMEIPCVATWVNGIPELIEPDVSGVLVAPADDVALADALERVLVDEEFARRLGTEARKRVMREYELNANVAHLAGIFRRHLGHAT